LGADDGQADFRALDYLRLVKKMKNIKRKLKKAKWAVRDA